MASKVEVFNVSIDNLSDEQLKLMRNLCFYAESWLDHMASQTECDADFLTFRDQAYAANDLWMDIIREQKNRRKINVA